MTTDKLITKRVSFQKTAFLPISGEFAVGEVLDSIKKGKYAQEIAKLRSYLFSGNTESYRSEKVLLPSVTFCATFEGRRRREHLKDYNRIAVIDIDDVSSDQELERIKELLANDKHVFCVWESPSQKGLKGLVQLDYGTSSNDLDVEASHKNGFDGLAHYFFHNYSIKLDTSGSDITRLCFVSHDPNLVLKESFEPFFVEKQVSGSSEGQAKARVSKKAGALRTEVPGYFLNPHGKNSPINRASVQSIIRFLEKRGISITSNCQDWVVVALAISNSFTFDIGHKYFIRLCRLDGENHDEAKSQALLHYCYENSRKKVAFSTIVYMARQTGYKT